MDKGRHNRTLLIITCAVFVWSGIRPHDYYTWGLEVFPVVIGLAILIPTYSRFRLTRLAYLLLAIHGIILMVGGHYTYSQMPLFNWIRDAFDLSRNHYDRLGHVAQGFVPAIVARELLLRTSPLRPGKWLFALIVLSCLGISATYELLEWGVGELSGGAAVEFLALQGDIWDTQKDMAIAGASAIVALLTLSRLHDHALEREAEL